MTNTHNLPEGYWPDARGNLIPVATIKPIDQARDALVKELVTKAEGVRGTLAAFKASAFADIAAFVDLSAEAYGVNLGGKKGNVQLLSFDGRYKVIRAIQESITFDERLQAAKALIDQCLAEWTANARPELKAIINRAFEVDKAGNTNAVLALRRMAFDDERWTTAMTAIAEAVQVTGSKSYIRVYQRVGSTDQYAPIALDIAGV
jgi:hypothetical protein